MTWREYVDTGKSLLGTEPWRTSTFKQNGLVKVCVAPSLEARGPEQASRDTTKEPLVGKSQELNSRETCQQEDKEGDKHGAALPMDFVPRERPSVVSVPATPSGPLTPAQPQGRLHTSGPQAQPPPFPIIFLISEELESAEGRLAKLQSVTMCIWERWAGGWHRNRKSLGSLTTLRSLNGL